MMRSLAILIVLSSVLWFSAENRAAAQMSPEEMQQKIQAMEMEIRSLKAQMGAEEGVMPAAAEGIVIGGGIETSYSYNFNDPDTRKNDLRVFDDEANGFDVQIVQINLQKDSADLGIGGRVDLDFLDTAELIAPFGTTSDDFDVQQAYVYYIAPLGSGLTVKAGKFVTLLGAEVIEPWSNWNYSRSLLFGFAIPFTHVGVLGSYTLSDFVSLTAGVVNGWDNVDDNNDGKSFLGNLTLGPWNWLTLGINGIIGPEQENENDNIRGVIDFVLTVKPEPIPQLTLMLNYDYGAEEDVPIFADDGTLEGSFDADWQGLAAYAKYDFSERLYAALRGEWFSDEDGARTGLTQDLWEITATGAYMVAEDLWLRVEYRHDDSDALPFLDGATPTDTQDTISAEVFYLI